MRRSSNRTLCALVVATALLVAACGGSAATPTAAPPTAAPVTQAPPASTVPATATPAATNSSTGAPALNAAAEVAAGTEFEVEWTGPNGSGDYITIVKLGTTAWSTEDYHNTSYGSPATLLAPSETGAYELWYVKNQDKSILARRPIQVLAFVGSLDAPGSVQANTEFDVTWTGPNGPGDYVTIVRVGATVWTNEDYFNTSYGNPAKLLAPVAAGAYELWYVTGTDRVIQVRRPITITATAATLQAPNDVTKGATFEVTWTGPNGPGDYITIVPAGSPPNTYLSYFNTNAGSPGTLTAPTDPGIYEVWYVIGQDKSVLASRPIKVN